MQVCAQLPLLGQVWIYKIPYLRPVCLARNGQMKRPLPLPLPLPLPTRLTIKPAKFRGRGSSPSSQNTSVTSAAHRLRLYPKKTYGWKKDSGSMPSCPHYTKRRQKIPSPLQKKRLQSRPHYKRGSNTPPPKKKTPIISSPKEAASIVPWENNGCSQVSDLSYVICDNAVGESLPPIHYLYKACRVHGTKGSSDDARFNWSNSASQVRWCHLRGSTGCPCTLVLDPGSRVSRSRKSSLLTITVSPHISLAVIGRCNQSQTADCPATYLTTTRHCIYFRLMKIALRRLLRGRLDDMCVVCVCGGGYGVGFFLKKRSFSKKWWKNSLFSIL